MIMYNLFTMFHDSRIHHEEVVVVAGVCLLHSNDVIKKIMNLILLLVTERCPFEVHVHCEYTGIIPGFL